MHCRICRQWDGSDNHGNCIMHALQCKQGLSFFRDRHSLCEERQLLLTVHCVWTLWEKVAGKFHNDNLIQMNYMYSLRCLMSIFVYICQICYIWSMLFSTIYLNLNIQTWSPWNVLYHETLNMKIARFKHNIINKL